MKKKNDFQSGNELDSSGFLLWQLSSIWQQEIKKILLEYKITHTQFVLLASCLWFEFKKIKISQVLLSNHTKIDPMTTSTVIRTLEKKKLLTRISDEIDSRAKTIQLTPNGRTLAQETVFNIEKFDSKFFKIKERKNLNKIFLKLLDNHMLIS